jgi:hypothetical protein
LVVAEIFVDDEFSLTVVDEFVLTFVDEMEVFTCVSI